MMSSWPFTSSLIHKLTVNLPKFGFCFPAKIFNAVDFPMPLVPTSPRTSPGRGVGRRWSLNELVPYLCVVSFSRLLGRLMMVIASNGHFWGSGTRQSITQGCMVCSAATYFYTYPTPNTQSLWDSGNLICWCNLNTQFPCVRIKNPGKWYRSIWSTSTSLPILTTGHDFLHSCRHFLGLHLSLFTMAIRVSFSCSAISI